ncbi:S16 family serine protease [Prosthecobacter sp.]|uniref:S16 family serine protease n=1 Tax=Prosthecobacter sp. TaxID=1965333 RepID=UPI0037850166
MKTRLVPPHAACRLLLSLPASVMLLCLPASGQLTDAPPGGGARAGGFLESGAIQLDPLAQPGTAPAGGARLATPTLAGRKESVVYAVWLTGKAGQASGGGTPITIRVEPNYSGEPAVGATEGTPGGLGNQWKSSFWMSAYNAARMTDHVLADYEFSIKVGSGRIDGPSASMLLAVGMLALLRGDDIIPGTTMTGTINPDGTCGPVGGIPHKMEGLKAMEKNFADANGHPIIFRRFGYPIGSRMSHNMNTDDFVDLHEWGKDLGYTEVREIADIYEAYEFFTGKPLPKPEALTESEMELPLAIRKKLRAKIEVTMSRLKPQLAELKERIRNSNDSSKKEQEMLIETLNQTDRRFANYRSSGLEEASYIELVMLHTLYQQSIHTLKLKELTDQKNAAAVLDLLASFNILEDNLNSLTLEASSLALDDNLAGRLTAIEALTQYSIAKTLHQTVTSIANELKPRLEGAGRRDVKTPPIDWQDTYQKAVLASFMHAMAQTCAMVAQDWLNVGVDQSSLKSSQEERLGRFSKSMTSVAGAMASYFREVVLTPMMANSSGSAAAPIGETELGYILAKSTSNFAEHLAPNFPSRLKEKNNHQIAYSSISFLESAALINRHYSLDCRTDDDGDLVIRRRKALSSQLDLARLHALEAASLCKKRLGFVPWNVLMNYQHGKAYRDGAQEHDKLTALLCFWQSTLSAEIALQLVDR